MVLKSNSFWIRFEFVLNSFWIHFKFVLNSFWIRFEFVLNSFWNRFEFVLNSFWNRFETVLKRNWFWFAWDSWATIEVTMEGLKKRLFSDKLCRATASLQFCHVILFLCHVIFFPSHVIFTRVFRGPISWTRDKELVMTPNVLSPLYVVSHYTIFTYLV